MTELTRDDLDKMTMKELAKHFGLPAPKPGTPKREFIDSAIAATTAPVDEPRTETPAPGTDSGENWLDELGVYLACVTVVFIDAGGNPLTFNPGQAHTVSFGTKSEPFPEADRTNPTEWGDYTRTIPITIDGVEVARGRLWHYTERRG